MRPAGVAGARTREVGFRRAFYTHRDSFESSDRRCTAGKRRTLEENGPDKVSWPV